MERLLLASVSTRLLGYVAWAPPPQATQARPRRARRGRPAIYEAATAGGVSQRIAKARANCFGRQTFEKLAAEAEELAAKGAFWSDPLFTHDDSSLFIDASRPPEDWLRDGERGKVIKGAEVVWCPPP